MIWFAGLRGAIAFALSLKAKQDYALRQDGSVGGGRAILTTTLVIVIFTIFTIGGSIYTMLMKADVFEKYDRESDVDMQARRENSTVLSFDRKYIKPFFTWKYQRTGRSQNEGREDYGQVQLHERGIGGAGGDESARGEGGGGAGRVAAEDERLGDI